MTPYEIFSVISSGIAIIISGFSIKSAYAASSSARAAEEQAKHAARAAEAAEDQVRVGRITVIREQIPEIRMLLQQLDTQMTTLDRINRGLDDYPAPDAMLGKWGGARYPIADVKEFTKVAEEIMEYFPDTSAQYPIAKAVVQRCREFIPLLQVLEDAVILPPAVIGASEMPLQPDMNVEKWHAQQCRDVWLNEVRALQASIREAIRERQRASRQIENLII